MTIFRNKIIKNKNFLFCFVIFVSIFQFLFLFLFLFRLFFVSLDMLVKNSNDLAFTVKLALEIQAANVHYLHIQALDKTTIRYEMRRLALEVFAYLKLFDEGGRKTGKTGKTSKIKRSLPHIVLNSVVVYTLLLLSSQTMCGCDARKLDPILWSMHNDM